MATQTVLAQLTSIHTTATEELLSQLTLEEKVSLLSGKDFRTTPGIPRLRIAQLVVGLVPSNR
jgi:hypothetical protein